MLQRFQITWNLFDDITYSIFDISYSQQPFNKITSFVFNYKLLFKKVLKLHHIEFQA